MPEEPQNLGPQLLTEEQVSAMTGIAVATLRNWRSLRLTKGPPAVKVGYNIRYRATDVARWLANLPMAGSAACAR